MNNFKSLCYQQRLEKIRAVACVQEGVVNRNPNIRLKYQFISIYKSKLIYFYRKVDMNNFDDFIRYINQI